MPANLIVPPTPNPASAWRSVAEFTLTAAAGDAGQTAPQVLAAVAELQLTAVRLAQIEEAIVAAVDNAAVQNDRLRLNLPVQISVSVAALADRDAACCWGFFVIARTADRSSAPGGPAHHTIELFLYQDRA
jgi:hypothetical protein